jgi:hypothetical protein
MAVPELRLQQEMAHGIMQHGAELLHNVHQFNRSECCAATATSHAT